MSNLDPAPGAMFKCTQDELEQQPPGVFKQPAAKLTAQLAFLSLLLLPPLGEASLEMGRVHGL